jgi:hypothetical protein
VTRETGLRNLSDRLSEARWDSSRDLITQRLESLEASVRGELAAGGRSADAILVLKQAAQTHLQILDSTPRGLVQFLEEGPRPSFEAARREFLGGSSSHLVVGPGTDFSTQPLGDISLPGADLRLTRWRGATLGDLTNADLRGADLRGAVLTSATKLEGAIFDQYTALPFARTRARGRGMEYQTSTVTESLGRARYTRETAMATRLDDSVDLRPMMQEALKKLPTTLPESVVGVRLFDQPKYISGDTFEAGVLESAQDSPLFTDLIEELRRSGGEIRRLVEIHPQSGRALHSSSAYFRLEGSKPIIALGFDTDLTALVHERQHMRDWLGLYQKHLERLPDRDPFLATQLAKVERGTHEYKLFTEKNAVREELRLQRQLDEAAGTPMIHRDYRYESSVFTYVISYPYLEAIRTIFRLNSIESISQSSALLDSIEPLVRRVMRNALLARRARFLRMNQPQAHEFTSEELFFESLSGNAPRYVEDGTLDSIQTIFERILPSEVARLPEDEFKILLMARMGS